MNFTKKISTSPEANLDLTPIVDVVFNLLIFFALSLNFSEITSSLNIKLPKAKSSETLSELQIVISIEKNNKIYIANGRTDNILMDILLEKEVGTLIKLAE